MVSEYMQYAGHMFLVLVKTSGDVCDLRDSVLVVNSGSVCYDLHRVCSSGYSAFISVLYVRIYCQNGNKDMFIMSILYPGATLSSHQCLVNSSTSVLIYVTKLPLKQFELMCNWSLWTNNSNLFRKLEVQLL